MTEPCLLELNHITRAYPQIVALDDLSLSVERGAIHGILGEDGAGKTTIMRIIGGVYPQSSFTGEIRFRDAVMEMRNAADAIRVGLTIVPRRLAVFEHLSIAENVMLARWQATRQLLISTRGTQVEAQAILDRWAIKLDASVQARGLNPGQQRLVLMARALAVEPQVIVLDEPLYGIGDVSGVSRILHTIRRLAEQRVTTLYLARRVAEVCQIADRVTVLRDGTNVGTWERETFDEAAMASAMVSRRPGDIKHIDDEEGPPSGPFGSLQHLFGNWFRPGS